MAELLIPADAERLIVKALSDRLTVSIGTRVPTTRPGTFGRVVAAGGGERDLVTDSFTVTLEGFAVKEGDARDLCARMLATLQALGREGDLAGTACYGVAAAALPANLPMPSVPDRYRYTATASVQLRRATA